MKTKTIKILFAVFIGILIIFTGITISDILIINKQQEITQEQDIDYKELSYTYCRSFAYMSYLETETIRHYQNASFELEVMPNCDVIYNHNLNPRLTYDDWMLKNNLTHLNYTMKYEKK